MNFIEKIATFEKVLSEKNESKDLLKESSLKEWMAEKITPGVLAAGGLGTLAGLAIYDKYKNLPEYDSEEELKVINSDYAKEYEKRLKEFESSPIEKNKNLISGAGRVLGGLAGIHFLSPTALGYRNAGLLGPIVTGLVTSQIAGALSDTVGDSIYGKTELDLSDMPQKPKNFNDYY